MYNFQFETGLYLPFFCAYYMIFLFLFFYESARARSDRIDSFSNFMYVYSRRKRKGSL